jgi:cytoskeletal protein CcmA (bactofilin family)/transcription elongation factor Elf1
MPARKPSHTLLNCPHCGRQQSESRAAFSAVCKSCGQYFRVQDVLKPAPKSPAQNPERKRIACPDCNIELDVAVNAQSTMCKRCSAYIDLLDYDISNAVSKNFRTDGAFVVQPKGYVFNTEAFVGDAVIRGRFLGKLVAKRSLTIYSTAEIKGTFTAGKFIIPEANHFQWQETIRVGSAEIAGELTGSLRAEETILLKSTARMFGDIEAGNLVVEEGAVVVGNARIRAVSGR